MISISKYTLFVIHYKFRELGVDYTKNVTAENEEKAVEYLLDYLARFSNLTVDILDVNEFIPIKR